MSKIFNQIVFAVNDKYIALLSVAIRSLLHTSEQKLIINIIYTSLSKSNILYITNLCKSYDSIINFYSIDAADFQGLPERGHLKVEAYYRMAIPRIIDVSKVLYLDCDILVTSDLDSLFTLDIYDYPLAAVKDPAFQPIEKLGMRDGAEYFNSGVMLLNLDYWRSHNIAQKTLDYLRANSDKITYADQCALNVIVNGKYFKLDSHFNFQAGHLVNTKNDVYNSRFLPKIIHFTGSLKPTHYMCENPYKKLFINELAHTPYKRKIKIENTIRYLISFFGVYPFVNKIRKIFNY